jgi:hypothetical protein
MRKSTIFISAVLTTFALVMLYRVASAYNGDKIAAKTAAEVPTSSAPTATQPPADVKLGPVDAANLAAQVVGNTNLLSAESSSYNGTDAYLVTFTNNDVVYVGLDGQILAVQIAPAQPVVVNAAPPTKPKHKSNNGGGQSVNVPMPAPGTANYEGGGEYHDGGHDD